jgi:hypothetical protein
MKTLITTAAAWMLAASAVTAQEERKGDELQREFQKSMKALQERFDAERAKLEKEFKATRERLMEKKSEPGRPEDPLSRLRERVDRIEKRLDELLPKFREGMPRFEFKGLDRLPIPPAGDWKGFQERLRKWMEQMPRPEFRENDEKQQEYRFEFKRDREKKENF